MTIEMTEELMIERIQKRMLKEEKISRNAMYDFKRRVDRSPMIKLLVSMLVDSENQRLHKQSTMSELHNEIKHLNKCLSSTAARRQVLKDDIEQLKRKLNDKEYISNVCNYYKRHK